MDAGVIDAEKLSRAEGTAQSRGQSLERTLVALGLADESAVWRCVAKAHGLKFVDPAKFVPQAEALKRVPLEQVVANEALPVLYKDGVLWLAIDDPLKVFVADNLAFLAGCTVQCALMPPAALKDHIRKLGGGSSATSGQKAATSVQESEDAPIIRLVQKTLDDALEQRASDVHVEPFKQRLRIRYRIDGVLKEIASLDAGLLAPLTSRLKIMAGLDIAEKRKPQDGRIAIQSMGRAVDVRTSVLPGNHGETIVMRLLDKEKGLLSLDALGFGGPDRERFERCIARPNGIVLVTGPTGSGKTTTLYSALSELNEIEDKLITTEDPVEYDIDGIVQVPIDADIGNTFAACLRSILRQDPDRILVGEIRDVETAEIAVQASLTGHMVFSTLHTNDAPSTVTRLRDMGVPPFLITATVEAILAQRLVRRICTGCREEIVPGADVLADLEMTTDQAVGKKFFRGKGCDKCNRTGYKGRLGIYELLIMNDEMRDMIMRNASTEELREAARRNGMVTLRDSGMEGIFTGQTTADEVIRETILDA